VPAWRFQVSNQMRTNGEEPPMLPPWMIEKLERERRERQEQERPSLQIEIQRPDERPATDDGARPSPRVVEIQVW
jgi:hypothetical protein